MAERDLKAAAENCPEETPGEYPDQESERFRGDVAAMLSDFAQQLDVKASVAMARGAELNVLMPTDDARFIARGCRAVADYVILDGQEIERLKTCADLARARADRAEARELAASTGILRALCIVMSAHLLLDIAGLL